MFKKFILFVLLVLILSGCSQEPLKNNQLDLGLVVADHPQNRSFKDHEFLGAVIIPVHWSQVEPRKGEFNWNAVVERSEMSLEEQIDYWSSSGKKVILRVFPYGQQRGNDITPDWVKEEVPLISFESRKENRGFVTIPKVWDEKFMQVYTPFVHALAQKYDNDSRVTGVQIGIGHLGFWTAQPSPEGRQAFRDAGFSLPIWKEYVTNVIDLYSNEFRTKKLFLSVEPLFLEPIVNDIDVAKEITEYAAKKNYVFLFKGVDADEQKFERTGFNEVLSHLTSLDLQSLTCGFGDDWPLIGQTGSAIRSVDDFEKILENVYSIWRENDKKCFVFLVFLDNELEATQKGNQNFDQRAFDALTEFKRKIN